MADVWLIPMGEGKRKKGVLIFFIFGLLSCYRIELEMDHCSNAPTGVFFHSFFKLDVIVSNIMKLIVLYLSSTANKGEGK